MSAILCCVVVASFLVSSAGVYTAHADKGALVTTGVSIDNSRAPDDAWRTEYRFVGTSDPPVLGITEEQRRDAVIVDQADSNWVVRVTVLEVLSGRPVGTRNGKVKYLIHSPTLFWGKYGYARNRLYTFEGRWRRDSSTGEVIRSLRVEPHWLPLWASNMVLVIGLVIGCTVVIVTALVLARKRIWTRAHKSLPPKSD